MQRVQIHPDDSYVLEVRQYNDVIYHRVFMSVSRIIGNSFSGYLDFRFNGHNFINISARSLYPKGVFWVASRRRR